LYLLGFLSVILFTACSKSDYITPPNNEYDWMRTHDKGTVAYVDYVTGNHIVETYGGFSVIESWGSYIPREYDEVYAYFSSRGIQTIYNWTGNYYTKGRVVESWLSWSDALYVLDRISYQ
ncbi:MAG: hypothetical protein J7497_16695, partial [Chitinophagaceae bacterium]|nr:hypothetical protein [Chitinophagaceae bacterium]